MGNERPICNATEDQVWEMIANRIKTEADWKTASDFINNHTFPNIDDLDITCMLLTLRHMKETNFADVEK